MYARLTLYLLRSVMIKRVVSLLFLLAGAADGFMHTADAKRPNFDAPAYAGAIPAPEMSPPKFVRALWTGEQLREALARLAPGRWLEVPGSELARVQVDACKSAAITKAYTRVVYLRHTCTPDAITVYSGGAYDTKRNRLLIWGGGHAGYLGNEIYAFEVAAARWTRLTEPSIPVFERFYDKHTDQWVTEDPVWQSPGAHATPTSVHSYDQLEYLPEQDALFAAGGSTYSSTGYASAMTWLFDLSKQDLGGWKPSQTMPAKQGLYELEMSTAYDPVSKRIVMRGYAIGGAFDVAQGKWFLGAHAMPTRRLGAAGEIAPKARIFLQLGGGAAETHTVDKDGHLGPPQRLDTTGAKEIEQCYGPGLAHDSKAEKFVAWCGGPDVYALHLSSKTWVRHSAHPDSAIPDDPRLAAQWPYGRFRYMPAYDAYIAVGSNRRNVFFYRLPPERTAAQ
jgi:hypothetical protein